MAHTRDGCCTVFVRRKLKKQVEIVPTILPEPLRMSKDFLYGLLW